MLEELKALRANALRELERAADPKEVESWRVCYLGKKSELTRILRSLGSLSVEERKAVGAAANRLRVELEGGLEDRRRALEGDELARRSSQERVDITLPGRRPPQGGLHPITQALNEICDIFTSMGFQVVEGPEVEWDSYNFEALNIPAEHPARDVMSTSWIDYRNDKGERPTLLRTHTTSVTARTLESMEPPIRVVEPGRVYRYEASDATHVPMFHQIDGIVVDKNVTMADLKGTLYEFARCFFGGDRGVRFRCDYFPFVEPGAEMAIECLSCGGKGCRLCSGSGWIEILGAGMTHPDVLRRGGIDPKEYSSFAFGMGIDRLPMLRHNIDDIRLFYNSDLRFLRQF